ncbi:MAG: hypothetical protein E7586_03535 [Ruminococcaceae bacterium]|nr:hypothetical protein [Oscillospiraceae bacterium]
MNKKQESDIPHIHMKNTPAFLKNQSKNHLYVVLTFVLILFLITTLVSCIKNAFEEEIIVEKDSWEELKQQMLIDYQINIPIDSELVYGQYVYQQEGLFLSLFFKAPESSSCELSEAWEKSQSSSSPLFSQILPDIDLKYVCSFENTKFPRHTFLSKSDPVDGSVYYFIHGYAPSEIIK